MSSAAARSWQARLQQPRGQQHHRLLPHLQTMHRPTRREHEIEARGTAHAELAKIAMCRQSQTAQPIAPPAPLQTAATTAAGLELLAAAQQREQHLELAQAARKGQIEQ